MSYYRSCPYCSANLDPDEHCDCKEKTASGSDTTGSSMQEYIHNSMLTDSGRNVKCDYSQCQKGGSVNGLF